MLSIGRRAEVERTAGSLADRMLSEWVRVHLQPSDGEPAHYMGYLVLRTANQREFSVIDGQQRLTTVSLIVLAAMRILPQLSNLPWNEGLAERLSIAL